MLLRHERGQAPDGFEPIPDHVTRLGTHVAVAQFLNLPATEVGALDVETFYAALVLMQAEAMAAKRQAKAARGAKGR